MTRSWLEVRFVRLLVALLFVTPMCTFAAQAPAAAQSASTAVVSGTVVDAAGQGLGGARVSIASATTTRVVRTAADGTFSVNLPPDTYSVTISDVGFADARQDGVTVLAGPNAPLRLALANATLSTIGRSTTTSRATALNTTTAAVANVSGQTFVDQGQPQVTNVLDQIPGVTINRASSNAPGANTSISLRGAQPYETQVLIDGHPVVTSANGASGFNTTFLNSLLLGDVEIDKGTGNLPITIENAIGGTANFITPTITGGPTGEALVGVDSFLGGYAAIRASDTFGKLGVLIGYAENETPGYLPPGAIAYGGRVFPNPGPNATAAGPYVGAVDFTYPSSQNFSSRSQLAKLQYNFSPRTSLEIAQYSTQSFNDETGTNYQQLNATIVPCYDTAPSGGLGNCNEIGGKHQNYTSTPNLGYVGRVIPIDLYGTYPNTSEFDNEPIYSAEFRTTVGPGSLLARYYTGTIDRIITQNYAPNGVIPCSSPACPNGNVFTPGQPPSYGNNAYYGEPYVEDTIDVLHGFDAQYTVPFGPHVVTLGFDRHVDTATFGEYDPTLGPPTFNQNIPVQSLAYSLRGTFRLTDKLTLESGTYLSSTSYVGTRIDPRDGLVFRPNPNTAIRASYGSAYAAPYYGLLNPTSYVNQGTLNLATGTFKPETSSGYDVGADFNLNRNTLFSVDGYDNTLYNRYASVTIPAVGTFGGTPYTQITQNGNQALVREAGLEFQFLYSPRVGFGFHSAAELLKDYAYGQNPNVGVDSIFSSTPDNGVQLPGYPTSKLRNDVFYSFGNGAEIRFGATSYGQNNAFGQAGFTLFDTSIRLPLPEKVFVNIGGSNLFNHDNYAVGGIYNGGPAFNQLGGGTSYTTYFPVQPRTLYIQLQRSVGPGGDARIPKGNGY